MNIGHLNVRSILADFAAFKSFLLDVRYDILCVSETWLDDKNKHLADIEGYIFYHIGRTTRGGGVGIYVNKKIKIKYIDSCVNEFIESLWISVCIDKKDIVLGCIYRPPKGNYSSFLELFEETLSQLLLLYDNMICLGDFNINMLDINNINVGRFYEVLDILNLKQIMTGPTRITSTTVSLLDLILVTSALIVESVGGRDMHGLSDHSLIYCTIVFKKKEIVPMKKIFRSFKYFNYDVFFGDLINLPWHWIYDIENIDAKVQFLNETVLFLMDMHAPIRTVTVFKPATPYITDTIKTMMSMRDKAFKKAKKTGNLSDWNYYKQLRNYTTAAIRRERKAYITYKFENRQSRELWAELRSLNIANRKLNTIPASLSNPNNINDYFIASVSEICNMLSNCNSNLNNNFNLYYGANVKSTVRESLSFQPINDDELLKSINVIKSNAVGVDGLCVKFIKLCCPTIVPHLTHLINSCIEQSIFPEQWKLSKVTPLPKSGSPSNYSDLRPISILPCLSKILERHLAHQLEHHLVENNILPETQSGFRRGFSCSTALAHITDDIIASLDDDKIVAMIAVDFSKAFDTLNHKLLISILHYIGLTNSAVKMFENYLSNRRQIVFMDGRTSTERGVEFGVPQGSVLGPLLYIIYTSCFNEHLKYCKSHYYADDTVLYLIFDPIDINLANERINIELEKFVTLAEQHYLKINSKKSSVICFSRKKNMDIANLVSVKIRGEELQNQACIKVLGLSLENSLRFRHHILHTIKKSFGTLKLLYGNRHYFDINLRLLLTNSLILSRFDYCDTVYGPCLDSVSRQRIQRLQNSCLRFAYGIRKFQHISSAFITSGWLKMGYRRKLHLACFLHRIILYKNPPYLYNKIRFRTDIHNINVRHRHFIVINKFNTELYRRSFSYNAADVYNGLPCDIKSLPMHKFKLRMRELLLQQQKYAR